MGTALIIALSGVVGFACVWGPMAAASYHSGYARGRKNYGYYGSGSPVEWVYARGFIAGVRKYRDVGPKPVKLSREQKTMNKLAELGSTKAYTTDY